MALLSDDIIIDHLRLRVTLDTDSESQQPPSDVEPLSLVPPEPRRSKRQHRPNTHHTSNDWSI